MMIDLLYCYHKCLKMVSPVFKVYINEHTQISMHKLDLIQQEYSVIKVFKSSYSYIFLNDWTE